MMDLVHSHSYVKLWELQKKKEWKQSVGMQVNEAFAMKKIEGRVRPRVAFQSISPAAHTRGSE